MWFERGPSQPSEMPLAPRVVTGGQFQGAGRELVAVLQGADPGLVGASRLLADLVGDQGLNAQFNADVAPAVDALEALPDAGDDGTLAGVVNIVDGVIGELEAQAADLPGPDDDDPGVGPIDEGEPPGSGQD
jgi:hypothetical protein